MSRKFNHLFPRLFGIAFLAVLVLASFTVFTDGMAEAGTYVFQVSGTDLRMAGGMPSTDSAVGPGGVVYNPVDSKDTAEVDTFLSQFINLGDSGAASITLLVHLYPLTKCDSCNDSMAFKFRLYTSPIAAPSISSATGRTNFYHLSRVLDSLIMRAHNVTDTLLKFEISADSLRKAGLQYLGLWTLYSDSVITTVADSTALTADMYLIGRRPILW